MNHPRPSHKDRDVADGQEYENGKDKPTTGRRERMTTWTKPARRYDKDEEERNGNHKRKRKIHGKQDEEVTSDKLDQKHPYTMKKTRTKETKRTILE